VIVVVLDIGDTPCGDLPGVETFYRGGTMATVARQLGIPDGTARSRLHYALQALRQYLQEHEPIGR